MSDTSEEPTLKITTLALICQLLLVASRRGAFAVDEFTKVGNAYDEVADYVKFHMPELFHPSERSAEAATTPVDATQLEFDFMKENTKVDEELSIGVVLDENGNIEEFVDLAPDNIIEGNFGGKATDYPDTAA